MRCNDLLFIKVDGEAKQNLSMMSRNSKSSSKSNTNIEANTKPSIMELELFSSTDHEDGKHVELNIDDYI